MPLVHRSFVPMEDRESRERLASGCYSAQIVESAIKAASSGRGGALVLTFRIIDGPGQGRQVEKRLSLFDRDTKTARTARAELVALCQALDCAVPDEPADLLGGTLRIVIRTGKSPSDRAESSTICGFQPLQGGESNEPPPSTGSIPPWHRVASTPPALSGSQDEETNP